MIDKARVRENFGRSAGTYDRYARVQKRMARELISRIKATGKDFRNILEIGCGTGFLTGLLIENFPRADILAVDISPQMIEAAKRRFVSFPAVSYLVADGENLRFRGSFDLITSSAVFQWFNSYSRPFADYYRLLKDDGCFIFNTLGEKTFKELAYALTSLGGTSRKDTFINFRELEGVLAACGFTGRRVEEQLLRDYYPSARELLVGIKKIGAQGHCFGAGGTYFKAEDIFKLINCYNQKYCRKNRVYASYEVLYGFAGKGRQTC